MGSYLGEQSPETKFFFDLTPEKILSSVEDLGFRCTGRVTQLNSMENRVFEVEIELPRGEEAKTPSDRFKVVKFYRPGRWSKEQILEEHEFLFDLERNEIPALIPVKGKEDQSLLKVHGVDIFYSVFPKIGGRNPDELTDDQAQWIGRLLARVHGVGASKKAAHRIKLTPDVYGIQNLKYLVDSKLIPSEVQDPYKNVVESICAFSTPLFARSKLQRIHGDCHFGNVLWGSTGAFLVDFDDMVEGPCVQDLWLMMPGRDSYARQKLEVMLSGYDQIRPFDRSSIELIEPLRALRFIHFSAWIGRRWNDPAFQRVFQHFGSSGYWKEQLSDLQDQLRCIQRGGFGLSSEND